MTPKSSFRSYTDSDRDSCLAVFDANCPTYFAPNERMDYIRFLDASPDSYEVCEVAGHVVAAFGLVDDDSNSLRLSWIMLDPQSQGAGLGSAIMKRVIARGRDSQSSLISIAASHKSAPFFARFGAAATAHIEDGWGPGMDRVDMELQL